MTLYSRFCFGCTSTANLGSDKTKFMQQFSRSGHELDYLVLYSIFIISDASIFYVIYIVSRFVT